jgi:hypothetical protein
MMPTEELATKFMEDIIATVRSTTISFAWTESTWVIDTPFSSNFE